MTNARKPSEDEYLKAQWDQLGLSDPIEKSEKGFDFNLVAARTSLESSGFLKELVDHLESCASEYAGGNPQLLYLTKPSDLQVHLKPFRSAVNKIYRINVIWNKKFPDPPTTGLANIRNIYDHPKANDLLRCRVVCKYMDGPSFVADKIKDFCSKKGLNFHSYPMNNESGYYAWHCYIKCPVDIKPDADVEERLVALEVQVTTQLAEVITALTHGLYEGSRSQASGGPDESWKWKPRDQQFRSAYLGHTLHLLEGIIQTFRDDVFGLDADNAASVMFGGSRSQIEVSGIGVSATHDTAPIEGPKEAEAASHGVGGQALPDECEPE